ncbi:MAG: BatB protein [Gammaproteobacteria bacterium]|nr:BatB protein [Gammaproteobacteria bacterium]MBR16306.1 BatB protein [Gammaproteobacteria bacterium]|tara:strand:+ start:328 stop:1329 length:1002 start_codon:yes stop_codon:yes gene_type:complete
MIEWLWPLAFLLTPAPILVRWLIKASRKKQPALTVPSLEGFSGLSSNESFSATLSTVKLIILWLAWILLIAAVARPQWVGEMVSLPTTGRDLMLAIDISGSMATEDMQVNNEYVDRLSVVKAVISQFLDARKGDRVGLVLFGTNAYVQAPLTFDLKSVKKLMIEAPVGIAGGKTAIGDAIGLTVKRLRERQNEEKVVILLTDGANNVGEIPPIKAAELASVDGIKIYTIGVGAEEMRVPSLFGSLAGRTTNPSADLDEETLSKIAEATQGRYFRAKDTNTLAQIYELIDKLEPIEQEPETYRPFQVLYYWPLGISLCLFLSLLLIDAVRPSNA